ncbi:MAG: PEP-CTERM sorting domain-containing protein [Verrucomicrobiaceae bacterium]
MSNRLAHLPITKSGLPVSLSALFFASAADAQTLHLSWTQEIGSSGTSGDGVHVNSFLDTSNIGSDGSANSLPVGSLLSHGKIFDGIDTVDYVVTLASSNNPLQASAENNAFVIHGDKSADFYSASFGSFGRNSDGGTFADNGNVALAISFFEEDSYNPLTASGTPTDSRLAIKSINNQPSDVGGAAIGLLSTDEFYDVDWIGDLEVEELFDFNDQITTNSVPGSTTLETYSGSVVGSTGETDPGTGGITDPLNSQLRLEFKTSHDVSEASWQVQLGSSQQYIVTRTGDPGKRSGIGFTAVPEPSSTLLVTLGSTFLLRRRRR